jgi:hypothetical protein
MRDGLGDGVKYQNLDEREEWGSSFHMKSFLIIFAFKGRKQTSLADAEQVREAENEEDLKNERSHKPKFHIKRKFKKRTLKKINAMKIPKSRQWWS